MIDLSHLRRVRRRHQVPSSDETKTNNQNLILHVLLGAVVDIEDIRSLNLSEYNVDWTTDVTIEALPGRMAESVSELQEFNQRWPTVYFPNRTVAHLRAERCLSSDTLQQLEYGMEAALQDGVDGVVILDPRTGTILGRASEERQQQQQYLEQHVPSASDAATMTLTSLNPLCTPILFAIQAVSRLERKRACDVGINHVDFTTGQYLCTNLVCCTVREPSAFEAMALVHARISMVVFGTTACSEDKAGLTKHYIHNLPDTNHRYRAFQCHPDSYLGKTCQKHISQQVVTPTTITDKPALEGPTNDENVLRRADEWEALMAVYEGDDNVSLESTKQNVWTIVLGRARLQMRLPDGYPSREAPVDVSVYAPHVSVNRLKEIENELHDLWTPDSEVILLWAEHVRAAIEEVEETFERSSKAKTTENNHTMENRPWPTTRLPWSALVDIIQVKQDIPILRRSQADERVYQAAMAEVRDKYFSTTDYILATKFDLPTSTLEDGKKHVVHQANRPISKRLMRNDFPYYFETNIEHWILWKVGGPNISKDEIQEAMEDLANQLGDIVDFLHWINPPALKSIKDIDHVHILCLRAENTDRSQPVTAPHDDDARNSPGGTLQFVPPTGKFGQPVRTFKRTIVMNDKYRRKIFRGEPFHPPKSGAAETMVAFCASVECHEHVQWVWAEILLNDPKVAKASHNMVAFRYQQGQTIVSDNDDDGEKGAGAKLASLLELANLQNVMVLVARWYGGVHLGPARFKWIASTARSVLVQAGFLKEK
jgi:tRNA(Arg) A34 adenosine deaminase TadA